MTRRALLSLFPALAVAQTSSPLTAGYAERDITPDIGSERPGGYLKAYHRAFHDPCKARVAVFGEGDKRVAIVGLDALVIRRPQVQAARAEIARRCGIAPDAVMIAASHSHSSGPTGMILPDEYDHASPEVRRLAYEISSCADAGYLDLVVSQTVAAVLAADASREPAQCGFGSGHEAAVSFNRRFRMKNGLSYTHPRQGNPEIVKPAGPIDPEVGVLGTWDKRGRLLGCIVNFACHATAGPNGISANWIYWMEKTIRGVYGPDVTVVFTAGANGDVTQVDNLSPHQNPDGAAWSRLVGASVGAEAVKALARMHPGDFGPLAWNSTTLNIPRRKPAPERVEAAWRIVRQTPDSRPSAEWTFAKDLVLLDALLAARPVAEVEVQAIQIGPAVYVSNPAEYFVENGLRIKRESRFPFTWPVELANGCVGYVPTEEAFGKNGGGYETRLTSYSNLEITAGTKIADAGIALANEFEPSKPPEPPAHPAFSGPWDYGAVPPQVR